MELTKNQQHLINLLKMLEFNLEEIKTIMLACQTEEATIQMLEFIIDKYEKKEKITMEMLLNYIIKM
jgi:DNA-binding transcriptional MerR regulator